MSEHSRPMTDDDKAAIRARMGAKITSAPAQWPPTETMDLIERDIPALLAEVDRQQAEIARLTGLIHWTLGEADGDPFPLLPDDWPRRKFYWRTELLRRFEEGKTRS